MEEMKVYLSNGHGALRKWKYILVMGMEHGGKGSTCGQADMEHG